EVICRGASWIGCRGLIVGFDRIIGFAGFCQRIAEVVVVAGDSLSRVRIFSGISLLQLNRLLISLGSQIGTLRLFRRIGLFRHGAAVGVAKGGPQEIAVGIGLRRLGHGGDCLVVIARLDGGARGRPFFV